MEMMPEMRNYVRGLNAGALTSAEVESLLDLMLLLDPDSGPKPTTNRGKYTAASVYVRLMQGAPVDGAGWQPRTWREGHAR